MPYVICSCPRHEWIRKKYNNINHRHLPQLKIYTKTKGHRGMNTCCILYKSNNVLDLHSGLELGGG